MGPCQLPRIRDPGLGDPQQVRKKQINALKIYTIERNWGIPNLHLLILILPASSVLYPVTVNQGAPVPWPLGALQPPTQKLCIQEILPTRCPPALRASLTLSIVKQRNHSKERRDISKTLQQASDRARPGTLGAGLPVWSPHLCALIFRCL